MINKWMFINRLMGGFWIDRQTDGLMDDGKINGWLGWIKVWLSECLNYVIHVQLMHG